jgi:hypothetical protein
MCGVDIDNEDRVRVGTKAYETAGTVLEWMGENSTINKGGRR